VLKAPRNTRWACNEFLFYPRYLKLLGQQGKEEEEE
jgi:hypothetical protein